MTYKALLADVDETLIVSKDSMPTRAVRDAVRKIKNRAHFGLATAKPFAQIKKICNYLELSGPSIVSGGAQIVDVGTGNYYVEHVIDIETIERVKNIFKKNKGEFKVWVQDNGVDIILDERYKPHKPFVIVINKIDPNKADELLEAFSGLQNVFITKTPTYNKEFIDVHISHELASKKHGVLKVAEILGIKNDEIIGVGDGYNDYSLLMSCGLKVAMGNAVPEIKAIANYVTKSVENDGIADVINKFF